MESIRSGFDHCSLGELARGVAFLLVFIADVTYLEQSYKCLVIVNAMDNSGWTQIEQCKWLPMVVLEVFLTFQRD